MPLLMLIFRHAAIAHCHDTSHIRRQADDAAFATLRFRYAAITRFDAAAIDYATLTPLFFSLFAFSLMLPLSLLPLLFTLAVATIDITPC